VTAWLAGVGVGMFVGGIIGLVVGMWTADHGRDLEHARQIEQIAALSTDLVIARQEIRKLRGDIGVAWDGGLAVARDMADQQRGPVEFWMPEDLAAQQRANREAN